MSRLPQTDPDRPVLIAGPTASGKSELALNLAREQGGIIINADAIQVYENWRILTARPDAAETARAPHALYGHVAWDLPYSVGHWLRDVTPLLAGADRPIIIGGTGLYFAALTEGLAEIPQTPPEIRAEAETILQSFGTRQLISDLDPDTVKRIDLQNPRRVQRAWEVARATGRGLAEWHADTPPPLLAATGAHRFLLDAPREWLTPRIETRFDQMLAAGALDEARANLDHYDPALPSMQAIGAADLMAHLTGQLSLAEAAVRATIATRQYAKRQRSWFRARMGDWQRIACSG